MLKVYSEKSPGVEFCVSANAEERNDITHGMKEVNLRLSMRS